GGSGAAGPTGVAAIAAANQVDPKTFPQADGRKTFDDIRQEAAATAASDSALLPAANDFVAGRVNRMPFGLFDLDHKPLWGPTVIYITAKPGAPAQGPFAVAAHALDVPARFRSKTSASDYDTIGSGFYTAIFNAGKNIREVSLMTLTRTGGTVRSALGGITLVADDPAPAPGERAPAIKTDTLADAHGDVSKIDTRVPPSGMHAISLDAALKKHKPIVLIFATPALCSSRVCGPVVDVAEQVKAKVGDAAIFIHQEIYNRNDPSKGYRKPVRQYGLTSEPFTFVIGADGRVVTQLQGPFVAEELETAIKAAARR
ncbi:MAG: hypothetical protein JJE27_05880, partial [Thermoleophilia bacterium]|nr:hypothetical protein [Thermoleophilia bacterium]